MKLNLPLLHVLWLMAIPVYSSAQCFLAKNKISQPAEIKQVLEHAQIPLDSIAEGDTLVTLYDTEFKKFFKMVRYQGKVAMIKQNNQLDFYYLGTQRLSTNGMLSRVNSYSNCGVLLAERTYNAQGVLILETVYSEAVLNDKAYRVANVSGGMDNVTYTENYLEVPEENRQVKHGWFKTWRGEKLVEEIEYDMGRKIAHNKF